MDKFLITAFVDNEIRDGVQKKQILSEIDSDPDLKVDYQIQMLMKRLVKEKVKFRETPEFVKERILKNLAAEQIKIEKIEKKSFLTGLFERPSFSFATALVVVLAVVLIIFNRPPVIETKDFAIEQLGSDNMFVQAKSNFKSILEGKLAPQLTTERPEEIKNYFAQSGVKYNTVVPSFSDWNILGAVVSEDRGEKFAHHVYVSKNGELAYLFQVDESYLYQHTIISLTDDLLKFLDEGNCYKNVTNGTVTLMTKTDDNICAIVSNADVKTLENTFCKITGR